MRYANPYAPSFDLHEVVLTFSISGGTSARNERRDATWKKESREARRFIRQNRRNQP